MAPSTFWKRFQKIHFYLLAFLLLQFLIDLLSDYRLHQTIIFYLTLVLYTSGIALFFRNLFPFRWKALYYLWYTLPIAGVFLLASFAGVIIYSIILYPVYPKEIKYEQPGLRLYSPFQGFMSTYSNYDVAEPKAFIFEKYLGTVEIFDDRSLKNARFVLSGKDTLTYYPSGKDTVIFLKLQ